MVANMRRLFEIVGEVVSVLWLARKPIGAIMAVVGIWGAASAFAGAVEEHRAAAQALPGCIEAEMRPHTPDGALKACLDRYTQSQFGLVDAGAQLYKETLPLTLRMR